MNVTFKNHSLLETRELPRLERSGYNYNGTHSLQINSTVCSKKYFAQHDNDKIPIPSEAKVAILLATYNGERFLAEQINSIEAQQYKNWCLYVSDDGSTDRTNEILNFYKDKWPSGSIYIQNGPAKGSAINFCSLLASNVIDSEFFAFCDQDDIWESDKLERAIRWLDTIPSEIPALYCTRTFLVDAENKIIGLSPLFTKPPSFANAITQNIGGGNTMVFNAAARALLRKAVEDHSIVTHDWWSYIVVTGCGGRVFYDSYPSLRYRQHERNQVGMNASWAARLKRIRMLWNGHFKEWNDRNISALAKLQLELTAESRNILNIFSNARKKRLIPRLFYLSRSGIYRQTLLGNLGLIAAAIFGKL
jgi:glycosyltransferase involved in cell wall biosynthesis